MTQKPENLPTHDVAGRFAAPIDQTAHEPAHWEKEADAIRLLLADKKRQIFTTDESRRVQEALVITMSENVPMIHSRLICE